MDKIRGESEDDREEEQWVRLLSYITSMQYSIS